MRRHSMAPHASAPAAAATCVLTSANAAIPLAFPADPALNPNQPNQSRPAPSTVIVRLCGGCGLFRLPSANAHTSADAPDAKCTTVPPAKSSAPILASQPPSPHTQCATGSY